MWKLHLTDLTARPGSPSDRRRPKIIGHLLSLWRRGIGRRCKEIATREEDNEGFKGEVVDGGEN